MIIVLPFNFIYLNIVDYLVKFIGLHWASKERSNISGTVFLCLIFNSFLVPLLLQANFSADYKGSFIDVMFSKGGRNSDMGSNWYRDIGS